MRPVTFFIVLSFLVISWGCASHKQAYVAESCGYDWAYEMGIADGRAHRPINLTVADSCPADRIVDLKSAYLKGYQLTSGSSSTDESTEHPNQNE